MLTYLYEEVLDGIRGVGVMIMAEQKEGFGVRVCAAAADDDKGRHNQAG